MDKSWRLDPCLRSLGSLQAKTPHRPTCSRLRRQASQPLPTSYIRWAALWGKVKNTLKPAPFLLLLSLAVLARQSPVRVRAHQTTTPSCCWSGSLLLLLQACWIKEEETLSSRTCASLGGTVHCGADRSESQQHLHRAAL